MQNFPAPIIEREYVGVNDNLSPETLRSGYFSKADNVLLTDNKISKVVGSTAIASSIAVQSFNGLAPFENQATGSKYLIANLNGASVSQLYSWNGSGSFSSIAALTSINNAPMWFETAANKIFGFDGTNVLDWDGTTATKNRAGVPKGTTACWFHNYLFVAGVTATPNRLYWCNLGDPTTFDAANFVDINPGDGDKIVSMIAIQDELLIFKRETIWSITGFSGSTFSATTIATQNTNARIIGYGCVSPFSVVATGQDVYFFSYLGQTPVIRSLRKTQLAVTLGGGIISYDINGTMDRINESAIGKVSGTFDGRYCRWAVPLDSSSVNNAEIILDTYAVQKKSGVSTGAWTTTSGKNASYYAISTLGGVAQVYFSDSGTTGLAFKINPSVYSDNGNPISIDVKTRSFMPDPARKQKWKYEYIRTNTGNSSIITVSASVDEAATFTPQATISLTGSSPGLGPTGSFTLGVSFLGGAMKQRKRITFLHLTGKTLQIEYTESSSNSVIIYDQEYYFLEKGLRNN